ncbi:MAG: bifunctional tetrahydrofolate synthase/dihydrofolate synthase [Buchnera aphidicola (Chaetogeoica yunlongensis)]
MINNGIFKFHSFGSWLNFLNNNLVNYSIDNSLERILYVAKRLGILKSNVFSIIVGGTNGKSTVCFILESLFLELGYQVGLYTSPHLIQYCERLRINGLELDNSIHIESFSDIRYFQKDILLTRFEFITLSSLLIFKSYNLDIMILEVGLGGKLDATNILDYDISVITNIGLDHMNVLGRDRKSISIQKSGIFRKNKICVIGDKNLPTVSKNIAKARQVKLKIIDEDWMYTKSQSSWNFFSKRVEWLNLSLPKISLESAAIALMVVLESGISIQKKIFRKSVSKIKLKGRFEIIHNDPTIILDVAHNYHAVYHLFNNFLSKIKVKGKLYAIVGMMKDKDIRSTMIPLISIVNYWYCVTLCTNRSATSKQILQYLPVSVSQRVKNMNIALKSVLDRIKYSDTILVFGSFHAVFEARHFLIKNKIFKV